MTIAGAAPGHADDAILARNVAAEIAAPSVMSFDMGGTTAKIWLIDDHRPLHSRHFEVAREYRFLKGSGMPLRTPVVEMVEIGAGGGSIADVDDVQHLIRWPGECIVHARSCMFFARRQPADGGRR